jgi:hypothetical protein
MSEKLVSWKIDFLTANQIRNYHVYSPEPSEEHFHLLKMIQKLAIQANEQDKTSFVFKFFKPNDQVFVKQLIHFLNELGYKTSYKRGTRLGKPCQLTISW